MVGGVHRRSGRRRSVSIKGPTRKHLIQIRNVLQKWYRGRIVFILSSRRTDLAKSAPEEKITRPLAGSALAMQFFEQKNFGDMMMMMTQIRHRCLFRRVCFRENSHLTTELVKKGTGRRVHSQAIHVLKSCNKCRGRKATHVPCETRMGSSRAPFHQRPLNAALAVQAKSSNHCTTVRAGVGAEGRADDMAVIRASRIHTSLGTLTRRTPHPANPCPRTPFSLDRFGCVKALNFLHWDRRGRFRMWKSVRQTGHCEPAANLLVESLPRTP